MNSSNSTISGGALGSQQRIGSASSNSNTILHSGASNMAKLGPNKAGQTRPSSAPAKRPSSPNQGANSSLTSGPGSASTQNRVKYSKFKFLLLIINLAPSSG